MAAGGQPIGQLMTQALAHPNLISLAAGFVDQETLPAPQVTSIFDQFSDSPQWLRRALQYGSNAGDLVLRQEILEFMYRLAPAKLELEPSRVIVTAGSNQLLHLVAETLFDPGDIVLTGSPTYFVFLGTLANLGVRTVGIASDEFGILPDSLRETLRLLEARGEASLVRSLYLIPYFDNPASTTIPLNRRIEIAQIVEQWREKHENFTLLADYAYQELGFEEEEFVPPWRSIDASTDSYVIELGTFSKSFSPGNRVGWGVFPAEIAEKVADMKANIDFGSPNLNQQLMAVVLESGALPPHIEVIQQAYRLKCHAMLKALDDHFSGFDRVRWLRPKGGLYVWMELPPEVPTGPGTAFHQSALEQGVLYVPGEYCYPAEGASIQRNTMRLTFGVQTTSRIAEGIELLAKSLRRVLG